MYIQSINKSNCLSCKSVYFTQSGNILFSPYADFLHKEGVKISRCGYKYIEDTSIASALKERFRNIPFIKNLAKNNDLFVWYTEVPKIKGQDKKPQNVSLAKIIWSNLKSPFANEQLVMGNSSVSQQDATENMFKKLEREIFENH